MEYITLKNSDLKVSRLCMGGCPMGGYGWGNVQETDLINAVHTAVDQRIHMVLVSQSLLWGKLWDSIVRTL